MNLFVGWQFVPDSIPVYPVNDPMSKGHGADNLVEHNHRFIKWLVRNGLLYQVLFLQAHPVLNFIRHFAM